MVSQGGFGEAMRGRVCVRRNVYAQAERILGALWGLLVHAGLGWCNGPGLVRTCACGSGGCDMTAIATWQVVLA